MATVSRQLFENNCLNLQLFKLTIAQKQFLSGQLFENKNQHFMNNRIKVTYSLSKIKVYEINIFTQLHIVLFFKCKQ